MNSKMHVVQHITRVGRGTRQEAWRREEGILTGPRPEDPGLQVQVLRQRAVGQRFHWLQCRKTQKKMLERPKALRNIFQKLLERQSHA